MKEWRLLSSMRWSLQSNQWTVWDPQHHHQCRPCHQVYCPVSEDCCLPSETSVMEETCESAHHPKIHPKDKRILTCKIKSMLNGIGSCFQFKESFQFKENIRHDYYSIRSKNRQLKLTNATSVKCWLLIISQALTPRFNTRRRKLTSGQDWNI